MGDGRHAIVKKSQVISTCSGCHVVSSKTTYCNAHAQQNELSAMSETKKMVHDLLDFKANWREVCDLYYFRDLIGNQKRLRR